MLIHFTVLFGCLCQNYGSVLEWSDGFYNGDIKTRKTVQATELDADQSYLRRSEQLRDLYESLSAGDNDLQARRPAAALSPEDLSDTEWYYLVCMSFAFSIGQGYCSSHSKFAIQYFRMLRVAVLFSFVIHES